MRALLAPSLPSASARLTSLPTMPLIPFVPTDLDGHVVELAYGGAGDMQFVAVVEELLAKGNFVRINLSHVSLSTADRASDVPMEDAPFGMPLHAAYAQNGLQLEPTDELGEVISEFYAEDSNVSVNW